MDENEKGTRILVGNDWMIRRQDALNWRAYGHREVNHDDGTSSMEWCPAGGFYGTPEGAARFIACELAGSLGDMSAKAFCRAFREACDALAEAVGRAA